MKVILVSKSHGRTRSFNVNGWMRGLLSLWLFGSLGAGSGVLYFYLQDTFFTEPDAELFTAQSAEAWQVWNQELTQQRESLQKTRRDAEEKLAALTLKVAELQARIVRLDALGERLTTVAKLDKGEFDFSQPPALGGPEEVLEDHYQVPDFLAQIDDLTDQIENRELQLETLEALLAKKKLQSDVFIAGRPIEKGWMSSRYGRRTDPFSGRVAWHGGVDFAGKLNSNIVSVAAGVVTWSGERYGYGQMVEINHGGGFSTRYAHNSENLVKVGDVVKKGQVIAKMGSSGRSTGPHVHFEVYKNGRTVDPSSYIHRRPR